MKWFIGFVLCIVFATAGAFGGLYYADYAAANKFRDMTGITLSEFDEAYANCVIKSGELCNLFGGFAPLSKFRQPSGTAL